jgi:hypothetical protein
MNSLTDRPSAWAAITPAGAVNSDLAAVPAASANGTALDSALPRPAGATSVIFELAADDAVTYAIKGTAPEAAPAPTVTRSGAEFRRIEQPLGPDRMIYITAKAGAPLFMWA